VNYHQWPAQRFFPESCVPYCYDLWHSNEFTLKIVAPRSTKLGDYRYHRQRKSHTITVNSDLNQYHFLLVYLHEVAHYLTYKSYSNKRAPHGPEWQKSFAKLMHPLIENNWVPQPLIVALQDFIKRPTATSCGDARLTRALRQFDKEDGLVNLEDLPEHAAFQFKNTYYRKIKRRRTRAVCLNLRNGRTYLISLMARVEVKTAPAMPF